MVGIGDIILIAEVEDKGENEKVDLEVKEELMNLMKNKEGSPSGSDYLNVFGSLPKLKCLLPFSNCKNKKKPGKPKKNRHFDVFDDIDYKLYGLYGQQAMKGSQTDEKKK